MASIGPIDGSPVNLASSGLGMQEFMRILLTQLTFQDPLKPMDNQQFMAQMAQFTALEQTQQLNDRMNALLTTQAALQSVGLIGRTVDVQADGGVVTGQVTTLSLQGDAPLITLVTPFGVSIDSVRLAQVLAVR